MISLLTDELSHSIIYINQQHKDLLLHNDLFLHSFSFYPFYLTLVIMYFIYINRQFKGRTLQFVLPGFPSLSLFKFLNFKALLRLVSDIRTNSLQQYSLHYLKTLTFTLTSLSVYFSRGKTNCQRLQSSRRTLPFSLLLQRRPPFYLSSHTHLPILLTLNSP